MSNAAIKQVEDRNDAFFCNKCYAVFMTKVWTKNDNNIMKHKTVHYCLRRVEMITRMLRSVEEFHLRVVFSSENHSFALA